VQGLTALGARVKQSHQLENGKQNWRAKSKMNCGKFAAYLDIGPGQFIANSILNKKNVHKPTLHIQTIQRFNADFLNGRRTRNVTIPRTPKPPIQVIISHKLG